jgi:starch-binding outer membrane protein, SusD/RagB family
MKRKIALTGAFLTLLFSSCEDYLDVKTSSKFDTEFVFQSVYEADKAVLGAYELLKSESGIHSNGLFYDAIAVNSDIEVGPETPTAGARYNHENLYNQTPQLSDMPMSSWDGIYNTINRCNILIKAFEANKDFIDLDKTTPSDLSHLYGEAVAIRATMYYELTRSWGDVIYNTKPIIKKEDYANATLTDRSEIQEKEIDNLIKVEPMMFRVNSGGNRTPERMSKEFVQGMIGRLALLRGGYALRPADYNGDGEVLQSHPEWGKMVRRSDWKDYYTIANTYLKKLVNDGNVSLVLTDPRTPTEKYNNPFQYVFQQAMDYQISPEMIFEVSIKAGSSSERPYAFGRPSDGGTTGYPPKAYGQIRFFPTYYYGMFDPKDLRRDVTVTTTALGGAASEKIISLKKGNKSNGGLALNKWDYSRMADKTYATTKRKTGINAPYMRSADMILLLSETYAVLGDEGSAKAELLKVRERAFDQDDPDYTKLVYDYVNSKSSESLMEAIQDERAFELGGEGQRKYDLVRWGIFGKKINALQTQMEQITSALNNSGYYEFENGNVLSAYIYTKEITKEESGLDDILTTTCNVAKDNPLYPILYPGWRGTFTDWDAAEGVTLLNVSIAIQGLFETIDNIKADELLADGYVKTDWGINLVDETWGANDKGIMGGYLPADYNANYPPRYILAIPATTIVYSEGNISNSYGFPND